MYKTNMLSYKDSRIIEIYEIVNMWIQSRLTMREFAKIVGISCKTLGEWKGKFTLGSALADDYWMEVGGIIDYKPLYGQISTQSVKSKWLEYCEELKKK